MNALPVEVLQEIASYLFGSDLISLRLINHKLSAIANIFKFRALHVRVTRRALDNLLNVSRQPELARCVREITYPYRRLAPMQNPWYSSFDCPFDPEVDFTAYNWFLGAWRLMTMFCELYHKKYVTQIELEDSGECVRTLETALSRMANIRAIILGHKTHDNFSIRFEFEKWLETLPYADSSNVRDYTHKFKMWEHTMEPTEGKEVEE
ncbi:hypothetical protein RUND412_011284 [Rhizina undulata]